MHYITREGTLPLQDEQGVEARGKPDIVKTWEQSGVGMPRDGDRRKEVFQVMFGMPVGTDRQGVTDVVRAFAAVELAGYRYAFTAHADRPHPHAYVVVKAADFDDVRLNPRKADLRRWRDGFAQALNERGI